MKTCKYQKYIPDYLIGELSRDRIKQLEAHWTQCEACLQALEELEGIHFALQNRSRPEPDRRLLRHYKRSLLSLFSEKPRSRPISAEDFFAGLWSLFSMRLARAALFVLVGLFLGRFVFVPTPQGHKMPESMSAAFATLQPSDYKLLHDFFVESEIFLLDIENWRADEETESPDLLLSKDIARKLLIQSGTVQQTAHRLNDESLITFLNRLELLLLEISNVSDDEIVEAFRDVRQIVQKTRLLQISKHLQEKLANDVSQSI